MPYETTCNNEAALAALLYVADKLPKPNMHKVAKILYFADKLHLERYGRQIFGDTYIAMPFGPVPSHVYNLVKEADPKKTGDSLFGAPEIASHLRIEWDGNVRLVYPEHEPDLDNLSRSDLLCLDESLELFSDLNFKPLSDLSHDAAWDAARKKSPYQKGAPMTLDEIIGTLDNADELRAYLADPHP